MKRNIIKTINIALLLVGAITGSSCSDLLDQKPQGEWNVNDQKGSFEGQVFAIYGLMRDFSVTSGTPALAIHNFRSEDAEKGSAKGDGEVNAKMYDDFEYSATNGLIASYWTGNYNIIHKSNTLLSDIKTEEEKGELSVDNKRSKAEAMFFRSFAYFNLVRAFGEVPLITFKLDQAEDANVPKSKVEDIYALIDSDLDFAAENLPTQWGQIYIGRLTSGAANALHARAHMTRNDWANTHKYASAVINSGMYNLNTPFDVIFREKGENSSESVFEIQCTATASQPDDDKIGSKFALVQGVRGAGQFDLGWGWHTPTDILASAFEKNDPRKDETLLYFAKTAAEAATMKPNKPYGEVPIAQTDVVNNYYNKKAYTDPALRAKYTRYGAWFNIRIIRYSDVLLMAAEAANELGNVSQASGLIEQVRARARGNNPNVLPLINTTDQSLMREHIRHERRIELAMEWDRFYDLVRWGIAKEVLHAAGKVNYQDKHAYLPIPQSQIDNSEGILVQNPNY